jgi:hypothetical protein
VWEWRAFGPPELLPVPARLESACTTVEERNDLYFLVRADAGLKVRSQGLSDKCELKLRYARDADGVEHWEKVFERRLPLDAPWLRELAVFLGASESAAGSRADSPPELASLCKAAGLGPPRLVLVKKRISKAPLPPAFTVESNELEVVVDGAQATRWGSISLEGPTLEIVKRVGAELGFPRAGTEGVVVAGYPEALGALMGRGSSA